MIRNLFARGGVGVRAGRPAGAWVPAARPARPGQWRRRFRLRLHADLLLIVLMVAASLLGTAWSATSPGSARAGMLLGVLAFVGLCVTLALFGWTAASSRALARLSGSGRPDDGARRIEQHGRCFAGWFAAHQLTWVTAGLLLATPLLLPRGASSDLTLAAIGGLLTVAVCALAGAFSVARPLLTDQAAPLAVCWVSPIPHGVNAHAVRSLLARAEALLLLPTRLAQARAWDASQPQPLLRKVVQVREAARAGRSGFVLDIRRAAGVNWRTEVTQRAALYGTIWLFGALVALLALRAGLIAPLVPALTSIIGVDPLAAAPNPQATPTPAPDAPQQGAGAGQGQSQGPGAGEGGAGEGEGEGEEGSGQGQGEGEEGSGQGQGEGQGDGQGQGQGDGQGQGQGDGSGEGQGQGQGAGDGSGQGQGTGQGQGQGQATGQQGQGSGQGQGDGQGQGSGQQQRQNEAGGRNQQGEGQSGDGPQSGDGQGQSEGQPQGQQGQGQQPPGQDGNQGPQDQAEAGGGQQPGRGSSGGDQQQEGAEQGENPDGGKNESSGSGGSGSGSSRGGDPNAPPTPPQLGAPTPVQIPSARTTDDIVSIDLPALGPGQPAEGTPQPVPGTPLPTEAGRAGPQGPNASGTAAEGSRSAGQPLPPWIQSLLDGAGAP